MRASILAGLAAALAVTPVVAKSPLLVTTVTAGAPDPNGKVPVFNGVPGSGVQNYDIAAPAGELFSGTVYTYCVSIEDLGFSGSGAFGYAITRGNATVQSASIGTIPSLRGNGIYALCINGAALPSSPGVADLTGSVTVTKNGKPVTAKLTVKVLLK